jgi:Bifunctional DNA primase/polymerase, N-terminal
MAALDLRARAAVGKETKMATPLETALQYIDRGWSPLPVKFKTKAPRDSNWETRVIDRASAPRFFNGGPVNIGVRLGSASHGLTDVDLDCGEAIAVAPYVLPRTNTIFGRPTKRASHWLYVTTLAGGGTRCQMQKLSSVGKFHDVAPGQHQTNATL